MGTYKKESHRIDIKILNADTNELISTIKNKSWMDVGEFLSDHNVDMLVKLVKEEHELPDNIIVLIAPIYQLHE